MHASNSPQDNILPHEEVGLEVLRYSWKAELADPSSAYRSLPDYGVMILPPVFKDLLRERESILGIINDSALPPKSRAQFAHDSEVVKHLASAPNQEKEKFCSALWRCCVLALEASYDFSGEAYNDGIILRGWARAILNQAPMYTIRSLTASHPEAQVNSDTIDGLSQAEMKKGTLVVMPASAVFRSFVPVPEEQAPSILHKGLSKTAKLMRARKVERSFDFENESLISKLALEEANAAGLRTLSTMFTAAAAVSLALFHTHTLQIVGFTSAMCFFGIYSLILGVRQMDAHSRRVELEPHQTEFR